LSVPSRQSQVTPDTHSCMRLDWNANYISHKAIGVHGWLGDLDMVDMLLNRIITRCWCRLGGHDAREIKLLKSCRFSYNRQVDNRKNRGILKGTVHPPKNANFVTVHNSFQTCMIFIFCRAQVILSCNGKTNITASHRLFLYGKISLRYFSRSFLHST